jgi:hypothetical protein
MCEWSASFSGLMNLVQGDAAITGRSFDKLELWGKIQWEFKPYEI